LFVFAELQNEVGGQGAFRSGAITPDGLIDEDFEEELGSPAQVCNSAEHQLGQYWLYRQYWVICNVM
jgi:hypothetical protein